MPTLKKDLFQRGPRMTHRFGQLAKDDFIGTGTFELPLPDGVKREGTNQLLKTRCGQHDYYEPLSPVVKPNGVRASMNGPAPDPAGEWAVPVPASTQKRKFVK